jgi:predicted nucleic acid-binding Zn ribbon protein
MPPESAATGDWRLAMPGQLARSCPSLILAMTTYVYETIPQIPGTKPDYFEIKQSMKDAALTVHPETGEPVRRVILGGFGILSSGKAVRRLPPATGRGGGCCGGSGCGCH